MRKIGFLKKNKAAGPGGLSSSFFRDSVEVVTQKLPELLGSIWAKEIPEHWCESVFRPIHKKSDKPSCESYGEINSVCNASKLFAGTILHRLSSTLVKCVRENQTGFRPGRLC